MRILRAIATLATWRPLEGLAQWAAAAGGVLGGLDERPAQRRRALVGDVPEPRALVGCADGRRHARPGAELPGRLEAGDVADLGAPDFTLENAATLDRLFESLVISPQRPSR